MLAPFRLYGLVGCAHCENAAEFMRQQNLPTILIIGNDDPIIEAGIKAVTGSSTATFPVLVCTFSKKIIQGFAGKEDAYNELARAYNLLFGASAPNLSGGAEQPGEEAALAPTAIPAGADELPGLQRVLDSPST